MIGPHGGQPVGSAEESDAAVVYDRIKRALMTGIRHDVLSRTLSNMSQNMVYWIYSYNITASLY